MTHGITCNLVTAGAPVTLNRSLITVPARIGSLAALSRATLRQIDLDGPQFGGLGLASNKNMCYSSVADRDNKADR